MNKLDNGQHIYREQITPASSLSPGRYLPYSNNHQNSGIVKTSSNAGDISIYT